VVGSAAGLLIGIAVMPIPAPGVPAGAAALLAFIASGAAIDAWSLAIVGSGLPDPVRDKFDDEIEAGGVLLVVDSSDPADQRARKTLSESFDAHLLWQSDMRMPKFRADARHRAAPAASLRVRTASSPHGGSRTCPTTIRPVRPDGGLHAGEGSRRSWRAARERG
jgi:hypothetical protein